MYLSPAGKIFGNETAVGQGITRSYSTVPVWDAQRKK